MMHIDLYKRGGGRGSESREERKKDPGFQNVATNMIYIDPCKRGREKMKEEFRQESKKNLTL